MPASVEPAPFRIGDSIDEYRVIDELGAGASAHVFGCLDVHGTRVAVKVYSRGTCDQPDTVERVRREAEVVAKIQHPSVCRVLAAGTVYVKMDGNKPARSYLVMEWIEGETLASLIGRRGPLPVAEAREITLQLTDALEALHGAGILHRDVKPDNIFVRAADGFVVLGDFGVVRDLLGLEVTATGQFLGTRAYGAPEAVFGDPGSDEAPIDIYSLAATLYTLLEGRPPFESHNPNALALMVRDDTPPIRRADLPRMLRIACNNGMAKRRELRPTLAQFRAMLSSDGADESLQDGTIKLSALRERIRTVHPSASQLREQSQKAAAIRDVRLSIRSDIASAVRIWCDEILRELGDDVRHHGGSIEIAQWTNPEDLVAASGDSLWDDDLNPGGCRVHILELIGGCGAMAVIGAAGGPNTYRAGLVVADYIAAPNNKRGLLHCDTLQLFAGSAEDIRSSVGAVRNPFTQALLRSFARNNGL